MSLYQGVIRKQVAVYIGRERIDIDGIFIILKGVTH